MDPCPWVFAKSPRPKHNNNNNNNEYIVLTLDTLVFFLLRMLLRLF